MTSEKLRRQVELELARLRRTVDEVGVLTASVGGRNPSAIERTAAGGFLAQFYSGVERVLKRIAIHSGVSLPSGPGWHSELLQMYRRAHEHGLPDVLGAELVEHLEPYLRFRHVVHHGYGFELRWQLMSEGLERLPHVLDRFETSVNRYLGSLDG